MFGEIIERKRLTIPKLEATIYELRGQAISSDEYGERVAGWLSERERRISEVDDEIRCVFRTIVNTQIGAS